MFGSKAEPAKLNEFVPVSILGNLLSPAETVKNLGVWFDLDFSLFPMPRITVRFVLFISGILSDSDGIPGVLLLFLDADPLVGSRLDYCNSLFRSFSALDLRKLQCVQSSLVKIVASTTNYSHITPVRKTPHWLPIKHRCVFKMTLPVYKFNQIVILNILNLTLNQDIVCTKLIEVNLVCAATKHFGLSFAYDTPRIWNDLLDDVRSARSLSSFRKKLET